ncbi:site-specific integrase [Streptomyces sp. NBC_01214]|uniref:site-specific integrase n=1 Tax=Streptomyces sp. NBC_01214 TaxID=2903777 RepID=UPI00225715DE|nr:site-specific integrase [Streptomyces sp. NBC_01214]MCX4808607.1 site-specific integrase [Streptomyces sp. NBC_01214]
MCHETSRARLSWRRAEEVFEENTRLLANPVASPEDIEDPDGWTLHRLRHSALTHDAEGHIPPMLLARSRYVSVRSPERYARPGERSPGTSPNATPPPGGRADTSEINYWRLLGSPR